jgi:hypothetical protein
MALVWPWWPLKICMPATVICKYQHRKYTQVHLARHCRSLKFVELISKTLLLGVRASTWFLGFDRLSHLSSVFCRPLIGVSLFAIIMISRGRSARTTFASPTHTSCGSLAILANLVSDVICCIGERSELNTMGSASQHFGPYPRANIFRLSPFVCIF